MTYQPKYHTNTTDPALPSDLAGLGDGSTPDQVRCWL
jgi:hypothetical protein